MGPEPLPSPRATLHPIWALRPLPHPAGASSALLPPPRHCRAQGLGRMPSSRRPAFPQCLAFGPSDRSSFCSVFLLWADSVGSWLTRCHRPPDLRRRTLLRSGVCFQPAAGAREIQVLASNIRTQFSQALPPRRGQKPEAEQSWGALGYSGEHSAVRAGLLLIFEGLRRVGASWWVQGPPGQGAAPALLL